MTFLSQVLVVVEWVWGFWQVQFLLAHIALNTLVAVAVSIYLGEFLLAKFGQFLYRKVLPHIILFAAFAMFGEATGQGAITNSAFLVLETMLLADLLDNLKKIGLPFPIWAGK